MSILEEWQHWRRMLSIWWQLRRVTPTARSTAVRSGATHIRVRIQGTQLRVQIVILASDILPHLMPELCTVAHRHRLKQLVIYGNTNPWHNQLMEWNFVEQHGVYTGEVYYGE